MKLVEQIDRNESINYKVRKLKSQSQLIKFGINWVDCWANYWFFNPGQALEFELFKTLIHFSFVSEFN